MPIQSRLLGSVAALGLMTLSGMAAASARVAQDAAKIGIFDMAAIRATPLDPEVIKKTEAGSIITEYVRFTSVPGVRVLMVLTYARNAKSAPGILFAQRFGAIERPADAKTGFVGVSVAPPVGNDDPKRLDSVGGPKYSIQASYRQLFTPDPNQSYIYHHVVALVRAIDYLETRPEINLSRTSVMGQDWTGMVVSLMHAIDNRPGAYFVWQGAGFYADAEGNSGDLPSRIDHDQYEMYSPAAYAKYGTQPIFVANPLNSDLSPLDALVEFTKGLKSNKVLAFSPNREEVQTARGEFDGSGTWQTYLLSKQGQSPSISSGKVTVKNSRLVYSCTANQQTGASLLVSYGKAGNWTGRNWHRFPMHTQGKQLVGDIPIYDPAIPMYVIGQISTKGYGERGNVPQFIEPAKVGIKAANSTYPHSLFDGGNPADETYISTYSYYAHQLKFGQPGPTAAIKSAIIPLYWDGMIRMKNIEPMFWKGATEVRMWLKGDGKKLVAPFNVHFAYDSRNLLDKDQQNYTTVAILKAGEVFPATWKEYRIPLKGIGNLSGVDSLFFETGFKPLQIAGLSWH